MKFSLNPDTESALHLNRTLLAPRSRVYQAWTDTGSLKQWFANDEVSVAAAELEFKVGGELGIDLKAKDGGGSRMRGSFREVRPNEMLVFTLKWEGAKADRTETLVTVEFREAQKGTQVSLTQENLPTPASRQAYTRLWSGCLDRLAKSL